MPRRVVGRSGLAEGEAGELNEQHCHRDIAVTDGVVVHLAAGGTREQAWAIAYRASITEGRELEVALAKRADHAILGGGAGIDRQRQT